LGKLVGDVMLALRVRAQASYEREFDRANGVETEGITYLPELTIKSPNKVLGSEYVPSPSRLADHAFSRLPSDLENYTFVDFGSGKGRIVLRAAMRSFKRVIGVEFAEELYAISKQNVAEFDRGHPHHAPIDLVLGDACEFALPDGPCVFFFYNPFRKPVMERVMANIADSLRRHPRKIYVLHLALKDERDNDADINRAFIESRPFLRRYQGRIGMDDLWNGLQFGSFKMDMFESVEGE
jgi:predicted RNA methylase